ncbi:hypothetical protein PIB30_060424 [Stylosanthes scabra]|uniref:Calponin-homology (CH) domain-containing protein n=1 Tax=Stylosanthes scabra TaxID=79078 RepID=A0ABU6TLG2_9FABA|nr:hypothetical protein [Stylosanthes scabra]
MTVFLQVSTVTVITKRSSSSSSHSNSSCGTSNSRQVYEAVSPIDLASDQLCDLAKDGVLLRKLINVVVPGTIDEQAINIKKVLNPWGRNENRTLALNLANAIRCIVFNIATSSTWSDFTNNQGRALKSSFFQIIIVYISMRRLAPIQMLADLNLKKTPQLLELFEDDKVDVEELISLLREKLFWVRVLDFHSLCLSLK